ncbi:MAG: 50S ribosomal protein L18 [Helicobacteraceae bacterium]|jgi:large subunit ribosomal protein L18|nr:50S ribosomal protein L18 [Helicobacteraceae bacterium]
MTDKILKQKTATRNQRKARVRSRISGGASKPRISVFRSNRYIYAQAIDDALGVTLAAFDGKALGAKSNKEGAAIAGKEFAKRLKEKKIDEVVFDRNGYLYHGVVAAFADALRENAIKL